MAWTTLISAGELEAQLKNVRVLDCRARLGEPDYGRQAHASGHIPGALHIDLDRDLASAPGRRGRHPLPDRAAWLATCQGYGLHDADQIVVYDDAGGAFAARCWWMLRWLGHKSVAVLDGGWAAWNGPTATQPVEFPPGTLTDRAPLTTMVEVDGLSRHTGALVDARAEPRFRGEVEPIDHTPGHIPGAVCLPFDGNLAPSGLFQPVEALQERFSALTQPITCYCGSGVTAAHNVLAIRHAGLPEPALYVGSWSEWIEDPTRPVATGR